MKKKKINEKEISNLIIVTNGLNKECVKYDK